MLTSWFAATALALALASAAWFCAAAHAVAMSVVMPDDDAETDDFVVRISRFLRSFASFSALGRA
jgi:hypothetical protein